MVGFGTGKILTFVFSHMIVVVVNKVESFLTILTPETVASCKKREWGLYVIKEPKSNNIKFTIKQSKSKW